MMMMMKTRLIRSDLCFDVFYSRMIQNGQSIASVDEKQTDFSKKQKQ